VKAKEATARATAPARRRERIGIGEDFRQN